MDKLADVTPYVGQWTKNTVTEAIKEVSGCELSEASMEALSVLEYHRALRRVFEGAVSLRNDRKHSFLRWESNKRDFLLEVYQEGLMKVVPVYDTGVTYDHCEKWRIPSSFADPMTKMLAIGEDRRPCDIDEDVFDWQDLFGKLGVSNQGVQALLAWPEAFSVDPWPQTMREALLQNCPTINFTRAKTKWSAKNILRRPKNLDEIDQDDLITILEKEITPGLRRSIDQIYTLFGEQILDQMEGTHRKIKEVLRLGFSRAFRDKSIRAHLESADFKFQVGRAESLIMLKRELEEKLEELEMVIYKLKNKLQQIRLVVECYLDYRKKTSDPGSALTMDDIDDISEEFAQIVRNDLAAILADISFIAEVAMPALVESSTFAQSKRIAICHQKGGSGSIGRKILELKPDTKTRPFCEFRDIMVTKR